MSKANPVNMFDLLSPEQKEVALDFIRKKEEDKHKPIEVGVEGFMLAEFGYYFGWSAIMAVKNNEISLEEMNELVRGATKVWTEKVYDVSLGVMVANSAPYNKNNSIKAFNDGLQFVTERVKVTE